MIPASLPGAEAALVAEPGPAWILEVPLQPAAGEPVAASRRLRLTCDDGVDPPAHLTRSNCEIVFDGVLYADSKSEVFGGLIDASVAAERIVDAYLTAGPDVLSTIKGTFAFVLLDGRDGTVLCARDRLGQYPLFYARAGSHVALSTSVEALLRHPGISGDVNRAMLAERLSRRWPCPGDETYITAVKRVPPGHRLSLRSGKLDVSRYWDPFPADREIDWIGEEEFERLDELLAQAVLRCLHRGPAGIFLSGGVDSCTVATTAADESRGRDLPLPLALSLLFPIGEQEERIQRGVAAGLGLDHVAVPVEEPFRGGGLIATALATSRRWPNPLWSPWHAAYQHLGLEARRQGCNAVLSGDGGDEFLTAHDIYAAYLLGARDFRALYRFWRGTAGSGDARELVRPPAVRRLWRGTAKPLLRHSAQEALRRTAPSFLHKYRDRHIARLTPDWLSPDALLRREVDTRAQGRAAAWDGVDPYLTAHRQPFDHPEGWMGREELFEVGRRFGARFLTPFWDSDLVDLLSRTPAELLVRGGRKGPARQPLARRFPGLGFEQPLSGSTDAFLERLIRREGPGAWRVLGGLPALAELGIVDPERLGGIVEDVFRGRWALGSFEVWTVFSVEIWLQGRILR